MANNCPYRNIDTTSYWSKSVARLPSSELDPIISVKFNIDKFSKISTAGSCFAQHISKHLEDSGFNYYIAEEGNSLLSTDTKKRYNYGTFSARYGNIYTTRQLIQTTLRAFGKFHPIENTWVEKTGRIVDPFRPYIQPEGFSSERELQRDREQHFAAIRKLISEFDVFVFTLGLTELWESRRDHAVFPVCPGCGVGTYDPEKYRFRNLSVEEIVQDLGQFIDICKLYNPLGKILLTVSPVPLIATMEKKHVLTATTLSKSILRVAAETIASHYDHVDYFPSYEIITGQYSRGRYYDDDLRTVTNEGVNHVMKCFFRHYAKVELTSSKIEYQQNENGQRSSSPSKELNTIICDEDRLENYV
ncbi:GSCFA domain-containing protein [Roseibium sediminicola]|uniref:GSCFA domain-containing protein n=1 Tax=Roseibium sediminicola TaxID=2933272 RepID=A0ABT0H3N3_9HYPH|nr:GSCFA domain-containing protein [Roseibium sp. CAU 1639]MCK7616241.1 GSCFA domain-containing protein [Roseibium sp. CAU 1639]